MSGLFLCVMAGCGIYALATGRGEALGAELMQAGEAAVSLALTLAGAYMLWCGLLKILEKSGTTEALAKRLARPVFTHAKRPCGVSLISQVPGNLRLGSLERLNQTCPPSTMQLSMEPVFRQ